ncbi:MAG TPA: DinB family protein [Tepidisphaeraceae bacterium]|nr:DinB family protein [Tepidisphaeraceae bacterium]
MLAHLAFWDETSVPVIRTMFRGGPVLPVEEWYGGTDLEVKPGEPWPDADTHNAREARWARPRSAAEVLQRLARAREKLKAVISTVTDEEARGPIGEQWSGETVCRHVDGRLAQVAALGAGWPPPAAG